ncbi:MAG TPA: hypothetical protein VHZ95_21675 [Polyangiales bacterium]|nr:hypothetical protein [Polyangiales bacterium]
MNRIIAAFLLTGALLAGCHHDKPPEMPQPEPVAQPAPPPEPPAPPPPVEGPSP